MNVKLYANIADESMQALSDALSPILIALGRRLDGDYGGVIEHVWIDVELRERGAKADGSARHPFRFQQRVAGRAHSRLAAIPDSHNVGHFSVRPDFPRLRALSNDDAIPYVLQLILDASLVLVEKGKKLGGFDGALFRARLRDECRRLGYPTDR